MFEYQGTNYLFKVVNLLVLDNTGEQVSKLRPQE